MRFGFRPGLFFAATAAVATLFPMAAAADKRVALVIGNSGYQKVRKLGNPVNDAKALAEVFRTAGFDTVDLRQDLGGGELRRAIRDFSQVARDADVAVVFYAGHGLEFEGNNYLVPIDAKLEWDVDIEDETTSLDRVLKMIEPAKRLRLVILDACRDNPFVASMKRSVATRAVNRGLAKVEPVTSDTLIAFAAKAGSTADDGSGTHSPFTTALLKHLAVPGLDLRFAFGRVRDDVLKTTRNKQEPFVYGSLGGDTISIVAPLPEPPRPRVPEADEAAWRFLKNSSDVAAVKQFVDSFPASPLRPEAEAHIAALVAKRPPPEPSAEEIAWDLMKGSRNADQLRRFLEQFPTGGKRADAERRLAELKTAAEQATAGAPAPQLATLSPPAAPSAPPAPPTAPLSGGALVHEIKQELKRVGCYGGRVDDRWSTAETTASVEKFVKHASLPAAPHEPDLDFLAAVRGKLERVCPLPCGAREVERNGRCVAKTCPAGLVLNDRGDCERPKRRVKTASRPPAASSSPRSAATSAQPATGAPSTGPIDVQPVGGRGRWRASGVTRAGQVACGPRGCQTVPKGCIAVRGTGGGGLGGRLFCP